MLLKNLFHHLKLVRNNLSLMKNYDVLFEPGVVTKHIDSMRFGQHCTVQAGTYLYGSKSQKPVVFGEHVAISPNCVIFAEGGVSLGDYTHLGALVTITTQAGNSQSGTANSQNPHLSYREVTIGKGCWLGSGSVIMPGTVLGDECIVAPNSVVYGVWGDKIKLSGNPARKIPY